MADESPRVDPRRASGAFLVEHCDVPADMTLGEWRRHCADEHRRCEPAGPGGFRGRIRRVLRRA